MEALNIFLALCLRFVFVFVICIYAHWFLFFVVREVLGMELSDPCQMACSDLRYASLTVSVLGIVQMLVGCLVA